MANRGRPIIHWNRYRFDESLNKWIKKKRYKHPVITVVKLDPDQALLVVCRTGGVYFILNSCLHGPGGVICSRTPKGRPTSRAGNPGTISSPAS